MRRAAGVAIAALALTALSTACSGEQPVPWGTGPADVLLVGWHTPATADNVELNPLEADAELPLIWGIQGQQMVLLGFDIPPVGITDHDVECHLTRRDDGRDITVSKRREGVTLEERSTGAVTYTNFFMVAVPGAFEWGGTTPARLACDVCGLDLVLDVDITDPTPGPQPQEPTRPDEGADAMSDDTGLGQDVPGADAPGVDPHGADIGPWDTHPAEPETTEDASGGAPGEGDPAWSLCTDEMEVGLAVELWPICQVCVASTQSPLPTSPVQSKSRFTRLEFGLDLVPTVKPVGISHHPTWALVEDVDSDGLSDLLLGTDAGPFSHWWARGTGEGELPFLPPVPVDLGMSGDRRCLGAADIDGDGWRDLVCDDPNDKLGVVLWGGAEGFGPDSDQLPLVDPALLGTEHRMQAASFGDLDGDGVLDLFLAGQERPEAALLGAGDREFALATGVLALPSESLYTFFVTPFAWDAWSPRFDGLWVANDGESKPNHALRVQGGKAALEPFDPIPEGCDFVRLAMMNEWLGYELTLQQLGKIGQESGGSGQDSKELGTFDGKGTTTPMGAACWFHLGEIPMCVLSQAGGPTPDYALAYVGDQEWGLTYGLGLERGRTTENYLPFSWGLLPLDLGDGRVDLVITNARSADSDDINPMDYYILGQLLEEDLGDSYGHNLVRYYAEQDDGGFEEVGEEIGLDALGQFATVVRFFAEGPQGQQLHLLVGGFDQPFVLYRLDHPTGNHLRVTLRGTDSEPNGLGALLTVVGGPRVRRARYGGESVQWPTGNTTREAVFGLGTAAAGEVWVEWPSGLVERFVGVAADSALHVLVEGAGEQAEAAPRP